MSAPRIPSPVTVSEDAGNAAIFGTLGVVLLLTVGFALMRDKTKVAYDHDTYLAARDTQGVLSMTLSYFVSGIGAWVIFAVPQAAVIGGSIGLVGYALSTMFPLLIFGWMAPKMRANIPKGFTMVEFVMQRSGWYNAVYVGLLSMFYMALYLTAELAAAGTLGTTLSKIRPLENTFWEGDNVFLPQALSPILGVSLITLAYTTLGGLPVSILTDRIQGAGVFVLTIIILIASYAYAGDGGDDGRFAAAAGHGIHPLYLENDYGNSCAIAISLIMGVTCANFFHMGYWQRVWAAESNRAVQVASVISSMLCLIVMILMGVTGWIAYSHYGVILMNPGVPGGDISFLSIPFLVRDFMGDGWAILMIIFGIAMIASTADSLQSAMVALVWPLTDKFMGTCGNTSKMAACVLVTALVNGVAIMLALSGQSVLQLFLLADLVCATAVMPILLGLWDRTHPIATLIGMLSGVVTMVVVYAIGETWNEGFDMIAVTQGGIFARSATYAFVFTPLISACVTVGVSLVAFPDYKFEGYKLDGAKGGVTMSSTAASSGAVPGDSLSVSSC